MFARRKRPFSADEGGGPLVEMAVILLPFLLIFAILIEGGNLLWRHQISLKAVRDTTRYVSRAPLLFNDACALNGTVLTATTTSAKLLGVTGSLTGGTPLVPNWTVDNIQIPTPVVLRADPCLVVVQAIADVQLPLPFAPILQLFNPEQSDTLTFSVADQARWLGE
ncbi:MAG: TadE family protein [Pseudomonadota bacterium]